MGSHRTDDHRLEELLAREGLQDLPEDNKKAIKTLMRMQHTYLAAERQVKVTATGLKKPSSYSPSTMTVRQFMCGYEAYVRAGDLSDSQAVKGLVTYLDPKSQERIAQAANLDKSSWENYKKGVLKILEDSSKYNALNARFDIRNAKQEAGETVHSFGERLRDLGIIGFPDATTMTTRDAALKDALAAGISLDEVAIQLIRNINKMNFDELLEHAITLETSHQARKTIRVQEDSSEIPVLRTVVSDPRRQMNPPNYGVPLQARYWDDGTYTTDESEPMTYTSLAQPWDYSY